MLNIKSNKFFFASHKGKGLKPFLLGFSVLTALPLLSVSTACAQSTLPTTEESVVDVEDNPAYAEPELVSTEPNEIDEEDVITVTGTNIRNRKSSKNTFVIDRVDIEVSGALTLDDLLRQTSQNENKIDPGVVGNFNLTGDDRGFGDRSGGVNLRGLGQDKTLILINGRRAATASSQPVGASGNVRDAGTTVDIESIPLRAVERIEIITDGASAIYGSDAVGGVVNIILRKDYTGFTASIRKGISSSGADDLSLGGTFGFNKDKFSGIINVGYDREDPVSLRDNDYQRDLSEWEARGVRRPLANPGASPANITIFNDVCETDTGALVVCDDFFDPRFVFGGSANLGVPDVFDFSLPQDLGRFPTIGDFQEGFAQTGVLQPRFLGPDFETYSVNGSFDYELSDKTTLRSTLLFSERKTEGAFEAFNLRYELFEDHPFNPLGSARGSATPEIIEVFYSTANAAERGDVPFREFSDENVNYSINLGFDHKMLNDEWRLRGDFTYSASESKGRSKVIRDRELLNFLGNEALTANPFGPEEIDSSVINALITDEERDGSSDITVFSLIADGEVGSLPGGSIGVALGIDTRSESFTFQLPGLEDPSSGEINSAFCLSNRFSCLDTLFDIKAERDIYAAFVETNIPIFSEDKNALPLVKNLIVTASARYDRYEEADAARDRISPALGARWDVNDKLTLRGNWNQSFRAPSVSPLSNPVSILPDVSLFFSDPLNPNGITNINQEIIGGNPDLDNEVSDSYSLGAVLDFPIGKSQLRFDVNYFRNKIKNQIRNSFSSDTREFIFENPDLFPELITRDVSTPNVIETFRSQPFNAVSVDGSGIDFNMLFNAPLPNKVYLRVAASATHNLEFNVQELPGLPVENTVGRVDGPQDFAGKFDIGLTRGNFNVGGVVNYNSGYEYRVFFTDNFEFGDLDADDYTTVDLRASYDLGDRDGILFGTRIGVVATNVFKAQPPFYALSPSGVGYFNGVDPRQRVVSFELTKEF